MNRLSTLMLCLALASSGCMQEKKAKSQPAPKQEKIDYNKENDLARLQAEEQAAIEALEKMLNVNMDDENTNYAWLEDAARDALSGIMMEQNREFAENSGIGPDLFDGDDERTFALGEEDKDLFEWEEEQNTQA